MMFSRRTKRLKLQVIANSCNLILDNSLLRAHLQFIVTRKSLHTLSFMSRSAQGWPCALNPADTQLVSYSRPGIGTKEGTKGG